MNLCDNSRDAPATRGFRVFGQRFVGRTERAEKKLAYSESPVVLLMQKTLQKISHLHRAWLLHREHGFPVAAGRIVWINLVVIG